MHLCFRDPERTAAREAERKKEVDPVLHLDKFSAVIFCLFPRKRRRKEERAGHSVVATVSDISRGGNEKLASIPCATMLSGGGGDSS